MDLDVLLPSLNLVTQLWKCRMGLEKAAYGLVDTLMLEVAIRDFSRNVEPKLSPNLKPCSEELAFEYGKIKHVFI